MKPKDQIEKVIFDVLSASLAKRICDNVDSAVDISREVIPRENLNEFVLALLIRQADMLHELVGTLLLKGKPTSPASSELKLLAGLLSHYGNTEVDKPYTTARKILEKLGHEVPETIIPEGA